MRKYHRLTEHLTKLDTNEWRASFDEIEKILGFSLPASAHEYPAWWANQAGGHAQSSAWQDAGWKTENLDLGGRNITFTRYNAPILKLGPNGFGFSDIQQDYERILPNETSEPYPAERFVRPLTIAQAKAGLAVQFNVPENNIEIIIKG